MFFFFFCFVLVVSLLFFIMCKIDFCDVILIVGVMKHMSLIKVFQKTNTDFSSRNPLKPHFCIVKLGFKGVYITFLISAQKHRLWYSLELPRRGGSNEYPQSMF